MNTGAKTAFVIASVVVAMPSLVGCTSHDAGSSDGGASPIVALQTLVDGMLGDDGSQEPTVEAVDPRGEYSVGDTFAITVKNDDGSKTASSMVVTGFSADGSLVYGTGGSGTSYTLDRDTMRQIAGSASR